MLTPTKFVFDEDLLVRVVADEDAYVFTISVMGLLQIGSPLASLWLPRFENGFLRSIPRQKCGEGLVRVVYFQFFTQPFACHYYPVDGDVVDGGDFLAAEFHLDVGAQTQFVSGEFREVGKQVVVEFGVYLNEMTVEFLESVVVEMLSQAFDGREQHLTGELVFAVYFRQVFNNAFQRIVLFRLDEQVGGQLPSLFVKLIGKHVAFYLSGP